MDAVDDPYPLSSLQIEQYRRSGFIQLPGVFGGAALSELRDAVAGAVEAEQSADISGRPVAGPPRSKGAYEQIFIQKVNLWTRHARVRPFVLGRRLGNLAAELSGRPARVWHDQALFKEPHTGAKTPWHQDAVYWPHEDRWDQITVWIALKDATFHNGCMSFVGGTQVLGSFPPIDLAAPQDIFSYAPQIKPVKPTTIELPAGSVTFHNGLTFHYAGPNKSGSMREAFTIIYMPDGTTYDGSNHQVTDPLREAGLKKGGRLEGEMFPMVSKF